MPTLRSPSGFHCPEGKAPRPKGTCPSASPGTLRPPAPHGAPATLALSQFRFQPSLTQGLHTRCSLRSKYSSSSPPSPALRLCCPSVVGSLPGLPPCTLRETLLTTPGTAGPVLTPALGRSPLEVSAGALCWHRPWHGAHSALACYMSDCVFVCLMSTSSTRL